MASLPVLCAPCCVRKMWERENGGNAACFLHPTLRSCFGPPALHIRPQDTPSTALASHLEIFLQGMDGGVREIHSTVLSALAIPYRQAFLREIQIFQAQLLHFLQPQPTLPEQVEGRPHRRKLTCWKNSRWRWKKRWQS